jgi:hypothetical protein
MFMLWGVTIMDRNCVDQPLDFSRGFSSPLMRINRDPFTCRGIQHNTRRRCLVFNFMRPEGEGTFYVAEGETFRTAFNRHLSAHHLPLFTQPTLDDFLAAADKTAAEAIPQKGGAPLD